MNERLIYGHTGSYTYTFVYISKQYGGKKSLMRVRSFCLPKFNAKQILCFMSLRGKE